MVKSFRKIMRKILLSLSLVLWVTFSFAQTKSLTELTVEEIMQSQSEFVGTPPSRVSWSKDSKNIFFNWNPLDSGDATGYKISKNGGDATKEDDRNEGWPSSYLFNDNESKIVFVKGGDVYTMDIKSKTETQITATSARESSPKFHTNDIITFVSDNNLFSVNTKSGMITQLTNFDIESSNESSPRRAGSQSNGNRDQDKWLSDDQLETSSILKEQKNRPRNQNRFRGFANQSQDAGSRRSQVKLPNARNLELSPDGKYVSFSVYYAPEDGAKNTIVPNYVTQSGYTTDIRARTKVGGEQGHSKIGIYNIAEDEHYMVDTEKLPGISDLPDYVKDYPDRETEAKPRLVSANTILWSKDVKYTIVHFASHDNKDRWIMRLMPDSGDLMEVDRQRDEAWIAGPGIGNQRGSGTMGFLPDNKTIYFQSEKSGYSHVYIHDLSNGVQTQLTSGNYEVYSPSLSKDGSTWYFTANIKHPGIRHFYSMPVRGGKITQITTEDGDNQVTMSPDEKTLAVLYSY
ncbi:MAG: Tol biopolymer transport system component, partial [Roseivirga sp.]